jgi:predicted membrane protein
MRMQKFCFVSAYTSIFAYFIFFKSGLFYFMSLGFYFILFYSEYLFYFLFSPFPEISFNKKRGKRKKNEEKEEKELKKEKKKMKIKMIIVKKNKR